MSELLLNHTDPQSVKELILDGTKISSISTLTQKQQQPQSGSKTKPSNTLQQYTNLVSLSLNNTGLVNLSGFPKLKNLKKLYLMDNKLSSGLEHLVHLENLTLLDLSGNKFDNFEHIFALKHLTNLSQLNLIKSGLSLKTEYHDTVFSILPQLKYLDDYDIEGNEIEEEDSDEEEDSEEFDSELEEDEISDLEDNNNAIKNATNDDSENDELEDSDEFEEEIDSHLNKKNQNYQEDVESDEDLDDEKDSDENNFRGSKNIGNDNNNTDDEEEDIADDNDDQLGIGLLVNDEDIPEDNEDADFNVTTLKRKREDEDDA
ncbi:hypothetical protein HK099_005762 [Clydaea vesicula]|uniref:Acidic leucine-rich nuclear phosphoprotein 32 family member A n=1 Tax=Clydaea vesicula TaxID=447962 RepID=A0AAD5TYU3_9FUNG|nr:hypothetical protein HK099_005762 [Clydaea vesicula]